MGKKQDGSGSKGKADSAWGNKKTDPESWWQKGCKSPNPTGRPKGSKNQKTLYREAFLTKVSVKVDGQVKKLTKDELSYQNFANRCASGDPRSLAIKLQYDAKFADPEPPQCTPNEVASNLKALDQYIALRQQFGSGEEQLDG
jgi:hypothetical protein